MMQFNISLFRSVIVLVLLIPLSHIVASDDKQKRCLYVSSYHQGYEWSDEIERSLKSSLEGKCEIRQIDMDTKRNTGKKHLDKITRLIVETIESWKPDVVITSDDNAAKHLIEPHYKESEIPFVFSGVNWTVEEYGFPYQNVTGIVEVAPVKLMLKEAFSLSGQGRNGVFISADTLSEKKNYERIRYEAQELNMYLDSILVVDFSQWGTALQSSSKYDFVVIGSHAGIKGWDNELARRVALQVSSKISVTLDSWMMPYSAFGYTKVASEQGEWAANAAIKILDGISPGEIPLATNKKWDIWLNEELLDKLQIRPNRHLLRKAKKVQQASNDSL